MDKAKLRQLVYGVFSDRNMLIISLLAIPIVISLFFNITGALLLLLSVLDWLIWLAFLLEFSLKLYVEDNKMEHIRKNELDSGISTVIILSPLASLFTAKLIPLPVFGVLRAVIRLLRFLAYSNKAAIKNTTKDTSGSVQKASGIDESKLDDRFTRFKPPIP